MAKNVEIPPIDLYSISDKYPVARFAAALILAASFVLTAPTIHTTEPTSPVEATEPANLI